MEHHSPESTAINTEPQHLRTNNYSRRSSLRNLITATAIGCFALMQSGHTPQKKNNNPADRTDIADVFFHQSRCINQIHTGESLLNTLLHVTVDSPEGPREIPFRVMHDRGEIIVCMDNGVFRSCNSIVGIGKISEQITDVTAQEDVIRLHSCEYGHADIERDTVKNVVLSLDAASPSEDVLQVRADARYVPVEGSPIQMAHSLYQSISGVFGEEKMASDKASSAHRLTFRRDQPERIAQISR